MKKLKKHLAVLCLLSVFVAGVFAAKKTTTIGSDDGDDVELVGTWRANYGDAKRTLTLDDEGGFKMSAWFDYGGPSQISRLPDGTLTTKDGAIISGTWSVKNDRLRLNIDDVMSTFDDVDVYSGMTRSLSIEAISDSKILLDGHSWNLAD
ncbi:hypothetical protein [Treponema succinifaciens]|uniref:hypothetical protein n=1 Tax=Treponema succinifaciens TaxID=167 RepID=UPI002356DC8E|nr:hypothetical protein [Treponema succinifaciens]